MISKYAKDDSASGGASTWIRETPLLVLIYEGIINNALDYDYAPQVSSSTRILGQHHAGRAQE